MNALLLGSKAIIIAIGKVLELFDVHVTDKKGKNELNLLVLVDGDKYNLNNPTLERINDSSKLIYIESNNKEVYPIHPLFFLTEVFVTYRMPLEDFSIVELAKIIEDIKTGNDELPRSGTVHKDKNILEQLIKAELQSKNVTSDFSKYIWNQRQYMESELHDAKENVVKQHKLYEKIIQLESLYAQLKIPKDISINVLVVENDPRSIINKLSELKDHFKGIRFFLIQESFADLKSKLLLGDQSFLDELLLKSAKELFENEKPLKAQENIKFGHIDLILQDIFLESGGISGTDLADLYFNVAPQAMVFFLTSMDVETLAASGYSKKVDRIVSKQRISALMKYYYDRFYELYGPVLWPVFLDAKDRTIIDDPKLTDKTSIRKLLANIRSWTIEPDILFHGYALPEMVDHEFRHTLGLWKMSNRILGSYLEKYPERIENEERIYLSLAIWLHDIGHRGDEHHNEASDIRENHASMAESIILENHVALGINWLREVGCLKNSNLDCQSLKNRNKIKGCNDLAELCPLRIVGILCKSHQSNAPLTKEKLPGLFLKLKSPSGYCRVRMGDNGYETNGNSQEGIDNWLNSTETLDCFLTDIRTLEEFQGGKFIKPGCLLRWLDALHTHNEKVGSVGRVDSFNAYLEMRERYCKKRREEIEDKLNKTEEGSEAYLDYLNQRYKVDDYEQLLQNQSIHLWRSGVVRDIRGEWKWGVLGQGWRYGIVFDLYENDPFKNISNGKETIDRIVKRLCDNYIGSTTNKSGISWHDAWAEHVRKEIIQSELNSQLDKSGKPFIYRYFHNGVDYYYKHGESEKKIGININKIHFNKVKNPEEIIIGERKKTLIIDCDPGCDDALALMLAIRGKKSPYKQIIITTVCGNVPVVQTTRNAQIVSSIGSIGVHDRGGTKIPITIYRGSSVSLMGQAPNVTSVHGRDGLGEVPYKLFPGWPNIEFKQIENDKNAVECLVKLCNGKNNDEEKYDLVCLGPLTNIVTALGIMDKPETFFNKFENIVIMGGAFNHGGNITQSAEFNFFFDPMAIKVFLNVLNKYESISAKKVVFVPLDVTEKVQLKREEIDEKETLRNPLGLWTLSMLQKYFQFHAFRARLLNDHTAKEDCLLKILELTTDDYEKIREKIRNERRVGKSGYKEFPRFCHLHDPLALYYAINPDKDWWVDAFISVHTGDDEKRGAVTILKEAVSLSSEKGFIKGTKVRYLSPGKIKVSDIVEFKKQLADACGLTLRKRRRGRIKSKK